MTGRPTQLDSIHEESDGEFPSLTGPDPDYNPAQSELSSSDVDVINLDKPSLFKESFSDEAVEGPDTDSGEDKDQQTDKCNIKKHKTPRNYVKRNKKKVKMNKDEVKTVTIKTCTKRQNGKQSWDKKHYCLYCGQPHSKIARHLKSKHMEIEDVAYAFSFPVGSKYRKALLDLLCSKGDFNHTAEVLEQCREQLVMCKQPSHKALVEDYLPCTYCYGMFARKELRKHQFSCGSKKSCMTNGRRKVQSHAARLPPIAASSDKCQKIIDNMRQDDVSFHIRTDSLICRYGEALRANHVRVKSRHQYVAQRMRELGQFMLVAKDMDKTVKGLEDLCAPSRIGEGPD
uniref:uncharacterized protein LOC117249624 n=1 Tax=Epinephelus lanceolatus TaxID=310571 RepID=UPI00144881D3|nr:uncharacterized protein LOC117249624 [Epinephelus lanceolatus]